MIARTASPPTTPPAIAPALDFFLVSVLEVSPPEEFVAEGDEAVPDPEGVPELEGAPELEEGPGEVELGSCAVEGLKGVASGESPAA